MKRLALLVLLAVPAQAKAPLRVGAYRVTFSDGSGLDPTGEWACRRTAATELDCVKLSDLVEALELLKKLAMTRAGTRHEL